MNVQITRDSEEYHILCRDSQHFLSLLNILYCCSFTLFCKKFTVYTINPPISFQGPSIQPLCTVLESFTCLRNWIAKMKTLKWNFFISVCIVPSDLRRVIMSMAFPQG